MTSAQTAAATAAHMRNGAARRATDPRELVKATLTVEAGVESGRLDIADHVRRVVDAAPPLTTAQRDRLAALLRPTAGTGQAAS